MYCRKCGKKNLDDSIFCEFCGEARTKSPNDILVESKGSKIAERTDSTTSDPAVGSASQIQLQSISDDRNKLLSSRSRFLLLAIAGFALFSGGYILSNLQERGSYPTESSQSNDNAVSNLDLIKNESNEDTKIKGKLGNIATDTTESLESSRKCRKEKACKIEGRCFAKEDKCITGNEEDCVNSYNCKLKGHCTFKQGRCMAVYESDCLILGLCGSGGCKVVNGNCVDKE